MKALALIGAIAFAASIAGAGEIANYTKDFKPESPATGWKYFHNPDAEIGNSSKYKPLVWNKTAKSYTVDAEKYPAGADKSYAQAARTNVHPGPGTDGGAANDVFAILSYTIQKGQEGEIFIERSKIVRVSDEEGAVEVKVYVNDDLKTGKLIGVDPSGDNVAKEGSVDMSLGKLKAGDVVYIAIGPNKDPGRDYTAINFALISK